MEKIEVNSERWFSLEDLEGELWKPVVGYEGLYEISSEGRVKRLAHITVDSLGRTSCYEDKILKYHTSKSTGYPNVNLTKNGCHKTINTHSLIADAFIPNPSNLPCINHKDENRGNSVLSNLERCDYSYNNSYGTAKEKRKSTLRKTLEGKHKKIYQFYLDGTLIKSYDCGVNQLEESLGYCIGDCLMGKSKTAHGFVFSYSSNFCHIEDIPKRHQKYVIMVDNDGNERKRYKSVSEAAKDNGFDRHLLSHIAPVNGIIHIKRMRFIVEQKENEHIPKGHKGPRPDLKGNRAKPICQYDREGNYIQEFNSTVDAADNLGNKSYAPDITNCCRGKLKTAKGYIWTYKGNMPPKPFKSNSIREIEQLSLDGEYIQTFKSIKEAAIVVGNGNPGTINNYLSGRSKSAFGYLWKYKTD